MPKLFHAFVNPVADQVGFLGTKPSNWNEALEYGNPAGSAPSGTDAVVRTVLSGSTTLFVRTDGNDSNNGLTDSAGGAFLTWQHAFDVISQQYDVGGQVVTIQCTQSGQTFSAGIDFSAGWTGQGSITVDGGGNTISASSGVFSSSAAITGAGITIQNFTLTTSAGSLVANFAAGTILLGAGLNFGSCTGHHIAASGPASYILPFDNYTISGGGATHYFAAFQGQIADNGQTVTITGSPTFSTSFARVTDSGLIFSVGVTWSGSVSVGTVRFTMKNGGIIDTNGSGLTYFPGGAAGTVIDSLLDATLTTKAGGGFYS